MPDWWNVDIWKFPEIDEAIDAIELGKLKPPAELSISTGS
jgi:hypothetical protein